MKSTGPEESSEHTDDHDWISVVSAKPATIRIKRRTAAPKPKSDPLESPTKADLEKRAKTLLPLSPKVRGIVGNDAQSLVLKNGHHEVLYVTRYQIAKKFEILRKAFNPLPADLPFHIPEFVGMDESVSELQFMKKNSRNEKFFKKQYAIYGALLDNNMIYKGPFYSGGTLEKLVNTLRYRIETIQLVRETLTRGLDYLHDKNITHNDLSPKNIYFVGEHPNFKFYLGDFGSITVNDVNSHVEKRSKDFSKLEGILSQMQRKLDAREGNPYTPYRKLNFDTPVRRDEVSKRSYGLRKP